VGHKSGTVRAAESLQRSVLSDRFLSAQSSDDPNRLSFPSEHAHGQDWMRLTAWPILGVDFFLAADDLCTATWYQAIPNRYLIERVAER